MSSLGHILEGQFAWLLAAIAAMLGALLYWLLLRRYLRLLEDSKREKSRLKYILDGTNVGTWEWNVQTGQTIFNERWAEIIGYSLKELGPVSIETWMKYAHPDDLEHSGTKLQAHFDGLAEFYDVEARMKHRQGHWVWVLDRGKVATWTPDGRPEWMYGTHQDISATKALQVELTQKTMDAERAAAMKSEFLAVMSHEIRTPMNGVLGLIRLARDVEDPPTKNDYLDGAIESGRLLLNVVNDILDYSKIEAGKVELVNEPCDLAQLFKQVLQLFTNQASEKGLSLNVRLSKEMPAFIMGDGARLRQVLNNLIGNAIKFTHQGAVSLHAFVENDKLCVSVQDSGIGIEEKDIGKLFQPFSQIASHLNRTVIGSGLGLVICKQLINQMGGDIDVQSELGNGSTFTVRLPVVPFEEDERDCPQPLKTMVPDLLAQLKGKHVLLAEDHRLNVMVIGANLDKFGITYDVAGNGREAILLLENSCQAAGKPYDLILMDIQMPVMNGLEATKHILSMSLPCVPPIVALTAAASDFEREQYKDAGMQDFLSKPLDVQQLTRVLIQCAVQRPTMQRTQPGT